MCTALVNKVKWELLENFMSKELEYSKYEIIKTYKLKK